MVELIGPAFAIAMLGAIESLLSAVVADGMAGTRHNSNQELIGQGIANIVAPLFGGIAATGAIARTATNIRNGGTSPLGGHCAFHYAAACCAVFGSSGGQCAAWPTLAAILFVVAWNMSEVRHFARMVKRAPRADVVILLVTFSLTVFADLVVAVNIGVVLAMLHFLRRMAASVVVREQTEQSLNQEFAYSGFTHLPPGVMVYVLEGPFFFAAVDVLEQALADTHTDPRVLIIRLRQVPFIDATGLQSLEEAVEDLHQRGVVVIFSEANNRVRRKLGKMGLIDKVGHENITDTFPDALLRIESL